MTPGQCRAARAWLGWTQQDLAERARVGLSTVKEFEGEGKQTRPAMRNAIRRAMERSGATFTTDPPSVSVSISGMQLQEWLEMNRA